MKTGYKVLGPNMEAIKGNGMIYELNTIYSMSGNIKCGVEGYHYFESIRDCMTLYYLKDCRVFECVLEGDKFDHDGSVHCTNHIRLTKELSQDEIKKYIEDNIDELVHDKHWAVRLEVAKQGYGLDILVNDEDVDIRAEVAKQGYGLDKLVRDANLHIREIVAEQGYGLDILVNDGCWIIREKIAKQGYGLDKLINDEHWAVRLEVAKQGYGLDILVNDEDADVRAEVVRQGYGLDILTNDEN